MPKLLIVEDEPKLLRLLVRTLSVRPQWELLTAENASDAITSVENHHPDLVLTDIRLPGLTGIEMISQLRPTKRPPAVMVMTAYASLKSAIEALRAGAIDYLVKPFSDEELLHALDRFEREWNLLNENQRLRAELTTYQNEYQILGDSDHIQSLRAQIRKVAGVSSSVLIRGESGTGKELVARAIHNASDRAKSPLIRVNCGSIPESLIESELFGHVRGAFTGAIGDRKGRFEEAGDGTLFLDEIGEISLPLQVKLLRVLQEREYQKVGSSTTLVSKARILAATNRDLLAMVKDGTFREDLYYRLSVLPIEVPPLRSHKSDIPLLVEQFIQSIANREGLSPRPVSSEFESRLLEWDWPGNIRELRNVIETALLLGESDCLEVEDLPNHMRQPSGTEPSSQSFAAEDWLNLSLEEAERALINHALTSTGGNRTQAAKQLGITRRALGYRCDKYGIN